MSNLSTMELRQLAEQRVRARPNRPFVPFEALALLHELDVHQVELELQNEQLSTAHGELQLAAAVFEHSYDGIFVCDGQGVIIDVNPAFTRITGLPREAALKQSPSNLPAFGATASDFAHRLAHVRERGHWRGEVAGHAPSGAPQALMLSLAGVRDWAGDLVHCVGAISDISHLKSHAAELDRMANFDPLTGLPNRRLFADRLSQAMARARRGGHALAVCYLDLDGFKAINDEFGHELGDQALVGITQNLSTILRGHDTLARIGGDEFVLLLDLDNALSCDAALARVLSAVSLPAPVGDRQVSLSASIGVTLFPSDDGDADSLLRHADQAMYRAKELGKNQVQRFDVQLARSQMVHREQVARLRLALAHEEFRLHYQPKVDLQDGAVVGVEALLRWQHPELGLQPPLSFLAYLQHSELDHRVGEWVLDQVLTQLAQWSAAGLRLVASANISPDHLLMPDFAQRLAALLGAHPTVSPALLELEILESATLSDLARAAETVAQCRALGVKVSLDDFGTGHSSLALLRHLPVDGLKIDQSFVRGLRADRNDHALVDAVIRLGDAFGRDVTAEGVEDLADAAELRRMGCRFGQGYGFARPMPASQFLAWHSAWRSNATWPPACPPDQSG